MKQETWINITKLAAILAFVVAILQLLSKAPGTTLWEKSSHSLIALSMFIPIGLIYYAFTDRLRYLPSSWIWRAGCAIVYICWVGIIAAILFPIVQQTEGILSAVFALAGPFTMITFSVFFAPVLLRTFRGKA